MVVTGRTENEGVDMRIYASGSTKNVIDLDKKKVYQKWLLSFFGISKRIGAEHKVFDHFKEKKRSAQNED